MSRTTSLESSATNSIWTAGGMVLATGCAFAANVLVPNLVSVGDAARYFSAITLVAMLSLLGRLGLERGIVKYTSESAVAEAGRLPAIIRTTARLAIFMSVIAAGLSFLLLHTRATPITLAEHRTVATDLLISAWVGAEVGRLILSELLRGLGQIRTATTLGDAGRHFLFLCAIFGFALINDGATWLVLLACAAGASFAIFAALSTLTLVRLNVQGGADRVAPREIVVSSWPFLVAAIGSFLLSQGDILVGTFTLPTTSLAPYAVAAKLAVLNTLPMIALNLILAPELPRLRRASDLSAIVRFVRLGVAWACLFTMPAALLLALYPDFIISILYPEQYEQAGAILRVLALGTAFSAACGPNAFVLLSLDDSRFVTRTIMVTAICQLAIFSLAASHFGPTAVAWCSLGGTVLLNILYSWRIYRLLGSRIDLVAVFVDILCARLRRHEKVT